jgi:hypothetical protein
VYDTGLIFPARWSGMWLLQGALAEIFECSRYEGQCVLMRDGWMGWRKMNLLDRMNGFARFALEPLYVVIVPCVASSEEFGILSRVREGI